MSSNNWKIVMSENWLTDEEFYAKTWEDWKVMDPLTDTKGNIIPPLEYGGLTDDPVNHPSHYTEGEIECIEAICAQLTLEEYRGYLKGAIAKYVWREKHKGGKESLRKAQWYLQRLLELTD